MMLPGQLFRHDSEDDDDLEDWECDPPDLNCWRHRKLDPLQLVIGELSAGASLSPMTVGRVMFLHRSGLPCGPDGWFETALEVCILLERSPLVFRSQIAVRARRQRAEALMESILGEERTDTSITAAVKI